METKKKQEELLLQLTLLEQETQKINQALEAIEQQLDTLGSVKHTLYELEQSKSKELLANLGRNIFARVEIKSDKLLVDVGNKVLVEKTASEAMEILDKQIAELEGLRKQLAQQANAIEQEKEKLVMQAQES